MRQKLTDEERRARQREYERHYMAEHPEVAERNRVNARAYYHANREKVLAYNHNYAKTHSLELSEYRHTYYVEHRDKLRAYQRERYQRSKMAKTEDVEDEDI